MSELCNWEHMLAKIARAEPSSPAGEVSKYHFLSFGWIIGGIVRAITGGRHLRDVASEYVIMLSHFPFLATRISSGSESEPSE